MYIICEDRSRPITSKETKEYLNRNIKEFNAEVCKGEIFTFQVCISTDKILDNVKLAYHQFDKVIPASNISCYNLEGINCHGEFFEYEGLRIDDYQVFWIEVKVPEDIEIGVYNTNIDVLVNNEKVDSILLSLDVINKVIINGGCDDVNSLARLSWLNSTTGIDDSVPNGFTPVSVDNNIIELLGKEVQIGKDGLISQINTYHTQDNSNIESKAYKILREPLQFYVNSTDDNEFDVVTNIDRVSDKKVQVNTTWSNSNFEVNNYLEIEYDGFMKLTIDIKALGACVIDNIEFIVPFTEYVSKYMMGLGNEGGKINEIDFSWNDQHQDAVWVGNINAGLTCRFKDSNYKRPFVNVYYNQRKKINPSWDNEGKGRIELSINMDNQATLKAETGSITLEAGDTKNFVVDFNITPSKKIDYKTHWETRYYHPHENAKKDNWLDGMDQENCNYINIHHGHSMHPFINYPFIETDELGDFIEDVHKRNKKIKLYYTMREITNHIKELWPLYSLGNEVFPKQDKDEVLFWKKANPLDFLDDNLLTSERLMWVEENIDRDCIPAWQHTFTYGKYEGQMCAAILVNPESRFNNYYVEGLNWLVNKQEIDGIYIDDTSYDRQTMERVRKVLDQRKGCLIDLHSWNHMNQHAGMVNCALLYNELMPFIDSIWFGEGFNYDKDPDYWLIEISGIAFGLMGEMLQDGGHLYRGMVYGVTNRSQWNINQPKAVHKLWDDFGIADSTMKGYWVEDCPVTIDNEHVRATAYVKDQSVLIAIGNWSEEDEQVSVNIDFENLNIDTGSMTAIQVEIDGVQEEKKIDLDSITIPGNEGCIILIS